MANNDMTLYELAAGKPPIKRKPGAERAFLGKKCDWHTGREEAGASVSK